MAVGSGRRNVSCSVCGESIPRCAVCRKRFMRNDEMNCVLENGERKHYCATHKK